jgi:RNA polymerase sigma-70 factor (sigma-E family)
LDATAEREFRDYVAGRQQTLFKMALLLAGHQQQAEDLLQSAFIRVAQHWSRVRQVDHIDAYVRRVMYHEYASWWRRRRVRETSADTQPDRPAPGDIAATVTLRVRLGQALRALPRQQRAAVILRYYEDLPEREVAAIMGCSVGAVRSHNARGLAKLRASCPDLAEPTASEVWL